MQSVMHGPMAHNGAIAGLNQSMDPKEHFYRHFEAEATTLQDQIANLGDVAASGGERQYATDHILAGISRLTNEVSDASEYAPPRDQMIYTEALKALREQLNIQTSRLGSGSRFSFTSLSREAFLSTSPKRSTRITGENGPSALQEGVDDTLGDLPHFNNGKGKNYNAEMASQSGSGIRKPSFSAARDIDISNHQGMHIILPATASRATSSGNITDLQACVLDMSVPTLNSRKPSPFKSLSIKNVSHSLIIVGHVAGPVHITGVKDSLLVINARQVRIHECSNVAVYLWSGSHPIIEDCKGMRFAEIPVCYLTDGQDSDNNQWNQVDDFNWLKAEASPNWKAITADDEGWVPRKFWETTVRGNLLLRTEDILRAAGVV